MAVKKTKKTAWDSSTQRHLPFSQIRENIVIMKDSSARVIMRCSTINFLLKSTEEQDAIIMSFQRFLNALDFPVQIMVRSTKLDIDGYLEKLKSKVVSQKNELLQNQTYEYIEYLKKLVEVAQIMKKWVSGRANTVKTSLESIWIRATELSKWELVSLLTDYYNPSLWNLRTMKSDISEYNLV